MWQTLMEETLVFELCFTIHVSKNSTPFPVLCHLSVQQEGRMWHCGGYCELGKGEFRHLLGKGGLDPGKEWTY